MFKNLRNKLISTLFRMAIKKFLPFIERPVKESLGIAETVAYIDFQIKEMKPGLEHMEELEKKINYEVEGIKRSIERHPISLPTTRKKKASRA